MSSDGRSRACQRGKHDPKAKVMRGQTYTLGETCAGYAGMNPCKCLCHVQVANAKKGRR